MLRNSFNRSLLYNFSIIINHSINLKTLRIENTTQDLKTENFTKFLEPLYNCVSKLKIYFFAKIFLPPHLFFPVSLSHSSFFLLAQSTVNQTIIDRLPSTNSPLLRYLPFGLPSPTVVSFDQIHHCRETFMSLSSSIWTIFQ